MKPMKTPERDDEPGAATGQDFARVWSVLAHIVTPTTFVAALMMYFGSVRTNTTYRILGVDPSMLGLSFQDYVLRSVGLTMEPLVMILLVLLAALPAHALLIRLVAGHRTAATRVAAALAVLGVVGVALGVVGLAGWVSLNVRAPVVPICLGLSVFLLGYSASVRVVANPGRARPGTDQVIRRTLFLALLLLLLLWSVAGYAQLRGEDVADRFRQHPTLLPGAVVYAPQRLYLEGAGITETALPDEHAMFRYRYGGLSLLIHSNHRYFLLPACWATTPQARAIALPDDESLRLEFFVVTTPPACPPAP
ncbi:hypothetical protein [Nonomuraea zeae]|uniref:Uncharacterized protein n=1 Tax=Nonomuraea zeae TaxID=1642303 RepID=A0A5S4FB23_9ACTN|nr:hypothetical protein [Nonomuraea zeae]TMR14380.1 hypothetical protein ETD85_56805 [Nonomuraea zeae]